MKMILIKQENFIREIKDQEVYDFEVKESGLYIIFVSAKCRNWLQNYKKLFNDDDLAVEIDGFPFFEYKGKRKEFTNPVSWNGNELKNKRKTNLYVIPLSLGTHKIKFFTDQSPFIEDIKIYKTENNEIKNLNIIKNILPIARNGSLFFNIAVKNIKLNKVEILAKAGVKDKLGIKINNEFIINSSSKKYKKWYWLGSQLKEESKKLVKEISQENNLNYLEFKGIGSPVIENVEFSIEEIILNKIGKVVIYKDIELANSVSLRKEPDNESELVCKIDNGENVEILEEVVFGKYIINKSYVWHKVKYKNQNGFVLSSYIEIEGQERDRIIEIIKRKAKETGIDENIVLALAGCESRYKPYAGSVKNALGIFQITEDLRKDLNNKIMPFYSPVENLFDFEKNIAAGIKYFSYLYNKVYKNSNNKLTRSLIYYNAGPRFAPSKTEKLNLNLYDKEVNNYYTCVSENLKKKNWKDIWLPALLIIFASINFGVLTTNYAEKILLANYFAANINVINNKIKIIADNNNNEVLILRLDKIIYKFPFSNLRIDDIFNAPQNDFNEKWRTIINKLAEQNGNIYFAATTSGYCGSSGCGYVIYQFNIKTKELKTLNDTIFGGADKVAISPDNSKMAFIYSPGSANGCGNSYAYLVDLSSFTGRKLKEIENKKFSDNYLNNVFWKNNNELEFDGSYWNCGKNSAISDIIFDYNIETGQLLPIKEKIKFGAG